MRPFGVVKAEVATDRGAGLGDRIIGSEIGEWRGALQPRALSEPDVNLSIHPAPIIQPWVPRPNGQTGSRRDAEAILTIPMPPACALGTVCICETPIAR